MSIKRDLFHFKGRLGSARFLGLSVIASGIFLLGSLISLIPLAFGEDAFDVIGCPIIFIAVIVALWATSALHVRRLHDIDKSGFYVIPIFILELILGAIAKTSPGPGGCIFLIFSLLFTFCPGTRGQNRFSIDSVG